MRRPRVGWMTQADDRILEFLENSPNNSLVATPNVIAMNIDYDQNYVNQRLSKMLDNNLVKHYKGKTGVYEITDRGRDYLAGDLDAEELE